MMTDWLRIGVGGYRLDAAIQLIEADGRISDSADTHCMLRELYKNLKGVSPNAIVVSEAWHDDVLGAASYLGDLENAEADWVLDVPRHEVMEAMWTEGSAEPLRALLRAEQGAQTLLRVAPYMGNHDLFRLPSRVPDAAARRAWMVAHVLLPGHPVLYYGEELDLPQEDIAEGYDLPQRRPLPWSANLNGDFSTGSPWYPLHSSYLDGINVADELADPESMLSVTRAVAAIRRSSAAVRSDQIELPDVSDPAIFAFARRTEGGGDDVLVVMNVSDAEVSDVTVAVEGEWIDLHHGAPYAADGTLRLGSMRAYDYIVLGAQDFGGIVVPGPR
jgi:alpha-amylase